MIPNRSETRVLSLTVDDDPRPGTAGVLPCHRYRTPQLHYTSRELGPLAADHIRIEILYAGVCGTDLHLLETDTAGYVRTSAPALIPRAGRIIGHEGVGRVIAAGESATGARPGDLVALASILACGHCPICRRGTPNQCPRALLLGMEIDGIFGTMVDVPAALAITVNDVARHDDDLKALACVEPAGVALLACRNARVTRGDAVLVLGGGPIGIFCAIICRTLGAARVELVEPTAVRRRLAENWCDAVYDVDEFRHATPSPVDIVMECSGDLTTIANVFTAIRPNGRVVLLSRSGEPLTIVDVDHLITGAISLIGSRGHLGVLPEVIELYRSGQLPLRAVITGELDSLHALHAILERPGELPGRHCKVLARIGSDR